MVQRGWERKRNGTAVLKQHDGKEMSGWLREGRKWSGKEQMWERNGLEGWDREGMGN
jgi:hypothetical protein